MFFRIGVLKSFTNYTRKRLCWSLIFKKLQRQSFTDTFRNRFFYRTPPVAAFKNAHHIISSTLKRLGGLIWLPVVFRKMFLLKRVWNPGFFVTFNTTISHIYHENFIEIPYIFQKIWRISLSVLAIFIDFLDFLSFPCYKETNDVSL